jgi:hypothetical protein
MLYWLDGGLRFADGQFSTASGFIDFGQGDDFVPVAMPRSFLILNSGGRT